MKNAGEWMCVRLNKHHYCNRRGESPVYTRGVKLPCQIKATSSGSESSDTKEHSRKSLGKQQPWLLEESHCISPACSHNRGLDCMGQPHMDGDIAICA